MTNPPISSLPSPSSLHATLKHFHTVLSHQNLSLRDTLNQMEEKFQSIESDLESLEMRVIGGADEGLDVAGFRGIKDKEASKDAFLKFLKSRFQEYDKVASGGAGGANQNSGGDAFSSGASNPTSAFLSQNQRENNNHSNHNTKTPQRRTQQQHDVSTELDKLSSLQGTPMRDSSTLLDDIDTQDSYMASPQQQNSSNMPPPNSTNRSRVVQLRDLDPNDDNLMKDIEFGTPSPVSHRNSTSATGSRQQALQSKTPELVDIQEYAKQQHERNRLSMMHSADGDLFGGRRSSLFGGPLQNNQTNNPYNYRMVLCTQKDLNDHLPPYLQFNLQFINDAIKMINEWLLQRRTTTFTFEELFQICRSHSADASEQQMRALVLALLKLNRISTRTRPDGHVSYVIEQGGF